MRTALIVNMQWLRKHTCAGKRQATMRAVNFKTTSRKLRVRNFSVIPHTA